MLEGCGLRIFLFKQGSDFSNARWFTNYKNNHFSLSCQYLGSTHQDGRGNWVFIWSISLSSRINQFFLFDAEFQSIFFNWVWLSCHCTLISSDLISIEEYSISRYVHTLIDWNQISNQNIILMNLHINSVSFDCYFLLFICCIIQLNELSFLLIVIYWSYKGTNKDSQ